MKRWIRTTVLLLALLALCGIAVAEELLTRQGSIALHIHTAAGENVENAWVEVYRAGEPVIREGQLRFDLTAEFAGSGADLENLGSASLASALDAHLGDNEIEPTAQAATSAGGRVMFDSLPAGLYLVRQNGFVGEGYNAFSEFACFVATIPMMNETGTDWIYQIEAQPKVNPVPLPSDPPVPSIPPEDPNVPPGQATQPPTEPTQPPEDPGEPSLPQTGMLRWPVPVMGIGGLVLFALGWALVFSGRRNHDA